MKETVDWLLTIERLAGAFYGEVAEGLKEDEKFSKFFRLLSGEEAWHAKVMESASEYLAQHIAPPFSISVDDETKEKIETPFIKNRELLSAGNFTRENVMDCLVTTEYSEWNDIFIYAVKSLREKRDFRPTVAKMQGHLRVIEQFMESLPEGRKHLYIIKSLPRVWKEHILIIDDDLSILEFLSRLLEHEGHVETAQNGREGLQKIKEKYFDVIISDIYMPVMDGIEFYNQASASDPEIRKRIMFFSGAPTHDHMDFFRKNNLKYLKKPAPIREIVNKVSEILRKTGGPTSQHI
ncbi:MAG: response regulator [Thermodesulfovibrionales bacterium]